MKFSLFGRAQKKPYKDVKDDDNLLPLSPEQAKAKALTIIEAEMGLDVFPGNDGEGLKWKDCAIIVIKKEATYEVNFHLGLGVDHCFYVNGNTGKVVNIIFRPKRDALERRLREASDR